MSWFIITNRIDREPVQIASVIYSMTQRLECPVTESLPSPLEVELVELRVLLLDMRRSAVL
jgi:hypothetical protein